MTGAFHSVGETCVHSSRVDARSCAFKGPIAACQIDFPFGFMCFWNSYKTFGNDSHKHFKIHPEELEKESVYSLADSLCVSYLSLQQVFSAIIKMLSQQLNTHISLLMIFIYLMELIVKFQHKLSELICKNCREILYLPLLNISDNVLWNPFGLWEKTNKKISIDLPSRFLSSPLSLAVSVPWLFFPTWRPSHSGFSSVCKVRKLPCLKLSGEFRSGLPYSGTLCLRIEITSACSCRKNTEHICKNNCTVHIHLKQF